MDFNKKRIFGMIHLSGDKSNRISRALEEIAIYEEEGLYGCIIENYHGINNDVEEVLKQIENRDNKIKIGINILPNEYTKAFELANQYNVDFIQLDYVAGEYEYTPIIDIIDYMNKLVNLKSNIMVFGGVWPKYYIPVPDSDLKEDIATAVFLVDGIVVTGAGTGKETPLNKIKTFKQHIQSCGKFSTTPLIIGAGLDASNVIEQLAFADGAIVGSCFKPYKRTQEKVSRKLVREFIIEVNKII